MTAVFIDVFADDPTADLTMIHIVSRLGFKAENRKFYFSNKTIYKSRKILVLSVEISAFNSDFIEKSAIFRRFSVKIQGFKRV